MDGGDLKTLNRWHGGDLKTLSRQHCGIFGLLGKLFGLGLSDKQHGGIIGLLGKLFGLGPGELQKQMSDPINPIPTGGGGHIVPPPPPPGTLPQISQERLELRT